MAIVESTAAREVNGIDVQALTEVMGEIQRDPAKGLVSFRVATAWKGQTRSRTRVDSYTIGGKEIHRSFTIDADEPFELLGRNTAPNPQELLMAALNACITVGYVAGAAVRGLALERVEIETTGTLDLRGFLGLDPDVPPGYESIRYVARIKGKGTPAQWDEIHQTVLRTSPNYFNVTRPVRVDALLIVE